MSISLSERYSIKYLFKTILIITLFISLIFTYIPVNIFICLLFYYIFVMTLVFGFVVFEWCIRPLYVYLAMMNFYVMTISFGLAIDINEIYSWLPVFTFQEYIQSFRIGIVTLFAIIIIIPIEKQGFNFRLIEDNSNVSKNWFFLHILIFGIIISIIALWGYAYYHKDAFFEQYIIHEELEGFDKSYKFGKYAVIATFDLLLYFSILSFIVYNKDWGKNKLFWILILTYFTFKIYTGGRSGIVVLLLLMFWQYYTKNNPKWLKKPYMKIACILSLTLLSFIVIILRSRNEIEILNMNIVEAYFYSNFFEFIGATVSLLFSVRYVSQGLGPPILLPFLDPLLSVLPTAIFPDKLEFNYFITWLKSIGGIAYYSPLLGVYLPGQIYLFSRNLVVVFIFFCCLSLFLRSMTYKLINDRKELGQMQSLSAVSFLLIAGVRTEYWIYIKVLLIYIFIVPSFIHIFAKIMNLKKPK